MVSPSRGDPDATSAAGLTRSSRHLTSMDNAVGWRTAAPGGPEGGGSVRSLLARCFRPCGSAALSRRGGRRRCVRAAAGSSSRPARARPATSPNSACAPSHSAVSGCGWTSTITPSAPAAMPARASGTTRSRRPAACDGSTITGRCDMPLHHRHRRHVEHVADRRLERAHAALAQHDVEVAALRDVLGGHQPLLVRRGQAALEHHRLARRRRRPAAARSSACCGCRSAACRRARRRRRRRRRP